jgi:hypothetical protein
MAIKRCPYCRAIIDEKDQYCKSCGTQLLFPEDEAVEEDIPGDRIVEEPEEEPAEEKAAAEEEVEEPVFAPAPTAEQAEQPEAAEEPTFFEDVIGQQAREAETILKSMDEPAASEPAPAPSEELKFETAEEKPPAPPDKLTFRTKELDRFMPTAELGKSQFEDFLASFKEDKAREEAAGPERETSDSGAIPPWAERIKAPGRADGEESAEAGEARPTSPSGIGIPEAVTQKPLPFGQEERLMPEREESEEPREDERPEMDAFGAEAEPEERPQAFAPAPARERVRRPPSRFKTKLKAMAFDLAFIGVFWAIALWLASRSMEVSLVRLVGEAALPAGLFYLVLLVAYWALFYFFLGETFGDRLFALSEE